MAEDPPRSVVEPTAEELADIASEKYGEVIRGLLAKYRRSEKKKPTITAEEAAVLLNPPEGATVPHQISEIVTRDETGPAGERIIEVESKYGWKSPNGKEHEDVSHYAAVIPVATINCAQVVKERLLEEAKEKGGRPPTVREGVRSFLACSTESMNSTVLSKLLDVKRQDITNAISQARRTCKTEGKPEDCLIKATDTLDAIGSEEYVANPQDRDRIVEQFCSLPCPDWPVVPLKKLET